MTTMALLDHCLDIITLEAQLYPYTNENCPEIVRLLNITASTANTIAFIFFDSEEWSGYSFAPQKVAFLSAQFVDHLVNLTDTEHCFIALTFP